MAYGWEDIARLLGSSPDEVRLRFDSESPVGEGPAGQLTGMKSKNRGGSGRSRARSAACWPGGGCGALGDLASVGGQGDQVHSVEFAAGVAPGVAGGTERSA